MVDGDAADRRDALQRPRRVVSRGREVPPARPGDPRGSAPIGSRSRPACRSASAATSTPTSGPAASDPVPAERLVGGDAEHGDPRGEPGADARLGVLDHHALPRLDAESGHRLPVGRRIRLRAGTSSPQTVTSKGSSPRSRGSTRARSRPAAAGSSSPVRSRDRPRGRREQLAAPGRHSTPPAISSASGPYPAGVGARLRLGAGDPRSACSTAMDTAMLVPTVRRRASSDISAVPRGEFAHRHAPELLGLRASRPCRTGPRAEEGTVRSAHPR